MRTRFAASTLLCLLAVVLNAALSGCGSDSQSTEDGGDRSSGLPTLSIGASRQAPSSKTVAARAPAPGSEWVIPGGETSFPSTPLPKGSVATPQLIVALDKYTGKVRWLRPRQGRHSYSTPLLIRVGEQDQVVSVGGGGVCAYHPRTGEELWWCRHDGHSVVPRPVFSRGKVFICTGYHVPSVYAIDPTGSGDVTESHVAWVSDRGTPFVPSPLALDDSIYLASDMGIISVIDADTGIGSHQIRIGGRFVASPWYADGRLHFLDEAGTTHLFKPGQEFEVIRRNELGERTCATPAISGASLFIRTEENLWRIEDRSRPVSETEPGRSDWPQFRGPDGQGHAAGGSQPLAWSRTENVVWKVPVPGLGWSSPVVGGNQVWLTSSLDEGRSLRAFCFDRESGRVLHDVEVFSKREPGPIHLRNSHASPTPVIDGEAVYVHFGAHGTACISRAGEVLWRIQMAYHHHHGPAGSPIVVDDLLIMNCDGYHEPYNAELMHAAGPDFTGAPE